MDCCNTQTDEPTKRAECPACGVRGRRVQPITLDSLLREGTEQRDERYRFCGSVDCDVAWFGEETGHRIPREASRVAIGQKETHADRTLCYCFGYSAADVVGQVTRTGTSTIPGVIADHCKRGEDHCPETNPQGSCCLGNVRAVMKASQAPAVASVIEAPQADACGCHIAED